MTEPDVPWVMVGRVVWWASQPHGPGSEGDGYEHDDTFPSWVCSSRDEIGPTSHTMPTWADLWAYAVANDLSVIAPGADLRTAVRADVDPPVPPRLWRSMCRTGVVHAEFAIAERANVRARCQEVVDFDNQRGCGPHRVEYSDDDGRVWRPEGTATP